MISYDFAAAIAGIYDQVRRQNEVVTSYEGRQHVHYDNNFLKDRSVALHLVLEVTADNHGYEHDGNTHHEEWERHFGKEMHFLMTGNHNVFLAVVDWKWNYLKDISNSAWKNISNHDSVWRDAIQSSITELMFEAWDHCFKHMPEEHLREKLKSSGVDMRLSDHGGGVIKFARISHEAVNTMDTYFRKITSVKPLKAVIGFKDE